VTLVLALDTATEYVAVGLAEVSPSTGAAVLLADGAPLAPRAANAHTLPLAHELLEECGRTASEIGAVVAGRGPGSFTGVRIGLATAKGLAQGLGVPLVAVPTLDTVAFGALQASRDAGSGGIVAVIGDAMRGEVYAARYRRADGPGVERLDPFTARKPAEVARRFAAHAGRLVLVGNGLAKYRDVFADALDDRAAFLEEPLWRPTASGLFAAAASALVAAFADPAAYDPGVALPIYTRLSDAEESEATREGRSPREVPASGVAGPLSPGGAVTRGEAGWPLAGGQP